MKNKFQARCWRCHSTVAAGEGDLVEHTDKWRVQHANCELQKETPKMLARAKRYQKGRSGFIGLDPW